MALFTSYDCCVVVILWIWLVEFQFAVVFVAFSRFTHIALAYSAVKSRFDVNREMCPPSNGINECQMLSLG